MNEKPAGPKPQTRPNSQRSETGTGRSNRSRPKRSISWGEIDNQIIRDAIVAVTDAGAAILLGATSDKGALSITVLDGNDRIREWPHDVDEAESTLRWLVDMFPGE